MESWLGGGCPAKKVSDGNRDALCDRPAASQVTSVPGQVLRTLGTLLYLKEFGRCGGAVRGRDGWIGRAKDGLHEVGPDHHDPPDLASPATTSPDASLPRKMGRLFGTILWPPYRKPRQSASVNLGKQFLRRNSNACACFSGGPRVLAEFGNSTVPHPRPEATAHPPDESGSELFSWPGHRHPNDYEVALQRPHGAAVLRDVLLSST